MDLKQLLYFTTIVKEGSISSAARQLHISQPPLSTQMHLLEEELGCTLFERGPRNIRLTPAGNLLMEKAEMILSLSESTKKDLQNMASGYEGTLKLGVVSSVSGTLLCHILNAFHASYPQIRYEIMEANTYQLLEQLRHGIVEMALIRTPFPTAEMESVVLKSERLYAAGHRSFFTKDWITLAELEKLPLILYRRWEAILTSLFTEHNLRLNPLCINDDARTTAYLTDSGLGVGILPESALSLLKAEDTRVLSVADAALVSEISMVRLKRDTTAPFSQLFWNFLTQMSLSETASEPPGAL